MSAVPSLSPQAWRQTTPANLDLTGESSTFDASTTRQRDDQDWMKVL